MHVQFRNINLKMNQYMKKASKILILFFSHLPFMCHNHDSSLYLHFFGMIIIHYRKIYYELDQQEMLLSSTGKLKWSFFHYYS